MPHPTIWPLLFSLLALTACGGGGGGGETGGGTPKVSQLTILEFSGTTLTPAFSSDTLVYTASVLSSVDAVTVNATTSDTASSLAVNGDLLGSGSVSKVLPLTEGANTFAVTLTPFDGTATRTYTVTVTRAPIPALDGLTLSAGTLSPSFDPDTTSYSSTTTFLVQGTTFTPSTTATGATIEVDGAVVASGQASAPIALAEGQTNVTIRIQTAEGESRDYSIAVTRLGLAQFAEEAFVTASAATASSFSELGYSIAVSGDTMAVGAWEENSASTGINSTPNYTVAGENSGAVYVFTRNGTTWAQQAYIKPDIIGRGDNFGISVSLSGDTLAVGAWREDSSTTGVNSTPNNNATDSGAAYVFTRNGTTWTQQAYIKASNTFDDDRFGVSVAVSGDTLAVGAEFEDSSATGINNPPNLNAANAGAVYVFARNGTNWTQQAYVKASNSGVGDRFGTSVALSGETLAVGALVEDSSTTGINSTPNELANASGAAYVFVRDGTSWSQQAYIKASNTGAGDQFGNSIALHGDTLAVGAYAEDSATTGINSNPNNNASGSGAAYVFARTGTTWVQQAYVKASNTGSFDFFGKSVALSDDTLVVGAPEESSSSTGINSVPNDNANYSGAAYVFTRTGNSWSQQAYVKASNTAALDRFGYSVAANGGTIAIGANQQSGLDQGAAYVFR
jgi:trimeric autotransporter adhesin